MAFAALAEAGAGRADDLGPVQQHVEEFPRVAAGVDPDVRRVVAADALQAEAGDGLADELRIAEVEIDAMSEDSFPMVVIHHIIHLSIHIMRMPIYIRRI